MTSARDQHLADVERIRSELFGILEGMEDNLDWRPDAESWSAREVITHLCFTRRRGECRRYPEGDAGRRGCGSLTFGPTRSTMTGEAEDWTAGGS